MKGNRCEGEMLRRCWGRVGGGITAGGGDNGCPQAENLKVMGSC